MAATLPAKRTHETPTPDDPKDLLGYYESVIDESVQISHDEQHRAWLALEQIHSLELWRLTHKSFSAYVEGRWGTSRRSAYRQIAWAREVRELPGLVEKVETRGTTSEAPSQRTVEQQRRSSRSPRGKAEAIEVGSDDTQAPKAQTAPTKGSGPSPRAGGATSPRGTQPPAPPRHEQLAMFPAKDLLEEAFNYRKDEVLAFDEAKRRQMAKRLRHWANLIDPPKVPEPQKTTPPAKADGRTVEPNFRKSMK